MGGEIGYRQRGFGVGGVKGVHSHFENTVHCQKLL